MKENTTKIFLSPLFITFLFVLLLNDFFLKAYFGNFLTGKLSDFAGLFVFPLFWTAFLPKRKLFVFAFTAVFFAFWKSSFSGDFIDFWNQMPLFDVARTVDYTDLTALAVLPLAWIYAEKAQPILLPRVSQESALTALAVVSLFAFTATSQAGKMNQMEEFNRTYKIPASPLDVAKKLQEIKTGEFRETKSGNISDTMFNVELNTKVCDGMPNVYFVVKGDGNNHSEIKLEHILYPCDSKIPDEREKLRIMFEREVIDFLKNTAAS